MDQQTPLPPNAAGNGRSKRCMTVVKLNKADSCLSDGAESEESDSGWSFDGWEDGPSVMDGAQRAASKLTPYSRGTPVTSLMPKVAVRATSAATASAASSKVATRMKPKFPRHTSMRKVVSVTIDQLGAESDEEQQQRPPKHYNPYEQQDSSISPQQPPHELEPLPPPPPTAPPAAAPTAAAPDTELQKLPWQARVAYALGASRYYIHNHFGQQPAAELPVISGYCPAFSQRPLTGRSSSQQLQRPACPSPRGHSSITEESPSGDTSERASVADSQSQATAAGANTVQRRHSHSPSHRHYKLLDQSDQQQPSQQQPVQPDLVVRGAGPRPDSSTPPRASTNLSGAASRAGYRSVSTILAAGQQQLQQLQGSALLIATAAAAANANRLVRSSSSCSTSSRRSTCDSITCSPLPPHPESPFLEAEVSVKKINSPLMPVGGSQRSRASSRTMLHSSSELSGWTTTSMRVTGERSPRASEQEQQQQQQQALPVPRAQMQSSSGSETGVPMGLLTELTRLQQHDQQQRAQQQQEQQRPASSRNTPAPASASTATVSSPAAAAATDTGSSTHIASSTPKRSTLLACSRGGVFRSSSDRIAIDPTCQYTLSALLRTPSDLDSCADTAHSSTSHSHSHSHSHSSISFAPPKVALLAPPPTALSTHKPVQAPGQGQLAAISAAPRASTSSFSSSSSSSSSSRASQTGLASKAGPMSQFGSSSKAPLGTAASAARAQALLLMKGFPRGIMDGPALPPKATSSSSGAKQSGGGSKTPRVAT